MNIIKYNKVIIKGKGGGIVYIVYIVYIPSSRKHRRNPSPRTEFSALRGGIHIYVYVFMFKRG